MNTAGFATGRILSLKIIVYFIAIMILFLQIRLTSQSVLFLYTNITNAFKFHDTESDNQTVNNKFNNLSKCR